MRRWDTMSTRRAASFTPGYWFHRRLLIVRMEIFGTRLVCAESEPDLKWGSLSGELPKGFNRDSKKGSKTKHEIFMMGEISPFRSLCTFTLSNLNCFTSRGYLSCGDDESSLRQHLDFPAHCRRGILVSFLVKKRCVDRHFASLRGEKV